MQSDGKLVTTRAFDDPNGTGTTGAALIQTHDGGYTVVGTVYKTGEGTRHNDIYFTRLDKNYNTCAFSRTFGSSFSGGSSKSFIPAVLESGALIPVSTKETTDSTSEKIICSQFGDDGETVREGVINTGNNIGVSILQNPVTDNIVLQIKSRETTTVQIFINGINGILYKSITTTIAAGTNTKNISATDLPKGFYLLKVQDHNNIVRFKFIKE